MLRVAASLNGETAVKLAPILMVAPGGAVCRGCDACIMVMFPTALPAAAIAPVVHLGKGGSDDPPTETESDETESDETPRGSPATDLQPLFHEYQLPSELFA